MRFPFVPSVIVLLGSTINVVSANCNPSYDVDEPAACVKECKISAGRALWSEWTDDPTSPNFIESLSYKCQRGDPAYTAFMTQSGTCMMNCSESENSDYGNREHPDSCRWYQAHKDNTCGDDSTGDDSVSPSPSSSSINGGNASPSGDSAQFEQPQSNDNNNNEQSHEETDGRSTANKLQLGTLIVVLCITGSVALL